jgi:hypothetical protein
VPEPAADHIDLDTRLQQVNGGRVPKDVGPDPAAGGALVLKTRGMPPDKLVDAEPRERDGSGKSAGIRSGKSAVSRKGESA